MTMTNARKMTIFPAFILFLMFLDQISKWAMVELYFKDFILKKPIMEFLPWLVTVPQERLGYVSQDITSFFSLVMVWNKGVGFGMFSDDSMVMPYVLGGVAVALSCVFLAWLYRSTSLFLSISLSAVVAGALSNAWDRVRFGAVADFLDFHVGGFYWPAFNVADSLVVGGIALVAFHSLFLETDERKVSAS